MLGRGLAVVLGTLRRRYISQIHRYTDTDANTNTFAIINMETLATTISSSSGRGQKKKTKLISWQTDVAKFSLPFALARGIHAQIGKLFQLSVCIIQSN